jgi:hypothetical protein
MDNFIFQCPRTGLNVPHTWLDEDKPVDSTVYEIVVCPACTGVHLINRSTGKVLGAKG